MDKGIDWLILEVVLDFGVGEFEGFFGKMVIWIELGIYYYDFEY